MKTGLVRLPLEISRSPCASDALPAWRFAVGVPRSATAQGPPVIRVDDSTVVVAENGGTYTQKVWLLNAPTAEVTVQVVSGDTSVLTVNPATPHVHTGPTTTSSRM